MSAQDEAADAPAEERSRRGVRRPGALTVFAVAFALLIAAAVCVGVGNFRPNTTLLPMISFYLSGAAVVLTVVALLLPSGRATREEPQEP